MINQKKDSTFGIAPELREKFINAKYGIAGAHSGVEICAWTKKSLRGQGPCYKQIFYGIDCHRCAQMSPSLAWCSQNCIFCWRPTELMSGFRINQGRSAVLVPDSTSGRTLFASSDSTENESLSIRLCRISRRQSTDKEELDSPEKIIEEIVKERWKLLIGIKGAKDVNKSLCKEAVDKFPSHWAISLSGEPTLYPRLGELIQLLRNNPEVKSIFLVTNGQEPEHLKKLARNSQLPTQLYTSLVAPNKELFLEINKPTYKDGWERLNQTLEAIASFNCRRVIRFTLIKGINDSEKYLEEFANLIEKSNADFLEVKAYMFLGSSRKRLKIENMPYHKDVVEYSKKLIPHLPNYEIINEHAPSRIVLFKRKDSKSENIIKKA